MPLTLQHNNPEFKLALWRIEEDVDFFSQKFHISPEIQNASSRLQWYATRNLVNEMMGEYTEVLKDEFNKPYLQPGKPNVSLTHTALYAGAMLSPKHIVGMDIEMIRPKIERIAHKFLRQDEIDAINPEERLEKLILYWSAKEALYKLHGRKQLEFMTQLLIDPFDLQQKGTATARIIADDIAPDNLTLHYEFFDDHVLTYVLGR